jgi:hypothetical protein
MSGLPAETGRRRAPRYAGAGVTGDARGPNAPAKLPTIALNRQFFEWCGGEFSDPDLILRLGRSAGLLSWESISARRRVVILAEAGSGKTVEMREQARRRTEAGQFAFYATLEHRFENLPLRRCAARLPPRLRLARGHHNILIAAIIAKKHNIQNNIGAAAPLKRITSGISISILPEALRIRSTTKIAAAAAGGLSR